MIATTFSTTVAAQSNPLVEQIFMGLPDSICPFSKVERSKMIKGGLERDNDEYEPLDFDRYPNGILKQKGGYFYKFDESDAMWEGKIMNTQQADEKLVMVTLHNMMMVNYQVFYKYNLKTKSFKKVNIQLPTIELDDVMDGTITAANRKYFNENGRQFVLQRLDLDNAIWFTFHTDYMESNDLPKGTNVSSYIYFDGEKLTKPAKKVNEQMVSAVRNEYNEVKKQIANPAICQKRVKKTTKMVSAIGEQTRTYTLFTKEGKTTFATQQFNIVARNYYDEYLFDANGKIRFAYRRYPTDENDMVELRYYFEDGRLLKTMVKVKKSGETKYTTQYEGTFMPSEWIYDYSDILDECEAVMKMK